MSSINIIILLLVHFSFIASIALTVVIMKKCPKGTLKTASVSLLITLIIWNLGTMLEMDYRLIFNETVTSTISIMLIDICYLAICFNPISVLFLGRTVYQADWKPSMRHLFFLVIPIISFMMVCTNPLHNLFFVNFSLQSTEAVYGSYYYFHSIYSYACVLWGLAYIIVFTFRSSGILSKQFFCLFAGVLVPFVGNILFSLGLADLSFSINACLFTVAIILIYIAIIKYRFIAATAIDMRQVVDLASEGFLQIDKEMRIVEHNKTLFDLFPNVSLIARKTTIGEFFEQSGLESQTKECMASLNRSIENKVAERKEISLVDSQRLTMKVTPFYDGEEYTGSVIIFKTLSSSESSAGIDLQSALVEIEKNNKYLTKKVEEGIAQLEAERQAAQALYDSNPNINFIVSLDFTVLDGNPSALKFYGFENKEDFNKGLFGKFKQSIINKTSVGTEAISITQRMADVMEYGETSFDTTLFFDGEEIPFHFNLKIVPYKNSEVIAVYQTDLRKLRETEKDLERRDMLLSVVNTVATRLISVKDDDFSNSLQESIAMLGRSVNVQRVTIWENSDRGGNLYCTQIHEWREDGFSRQHGKPHTIEVRYSEYVPIWETTLMSGKCVNTVVKNLSLADREQMDMQGIVSVLAIPVFISDKFWGFVGFDDCVNERVFSAAEENSLKSGAMLVASALLRNDVTRKMVLAKEAALESAKAKSVFLANMSHEIRTPLNAIVGMANIAKRRADDNRVVCSIDEILSASKHLMDLINDILDFSKIESGKLDLADEAFYLSSMIQEVVSLIKPRCDEKSIVFETDLNALPEMAVLGDRLRIKQVLINILGNAVKFTNQNGTVKFATSVLSQSDNDIALQFFIKDNGIGISKEQIPNLFTAFERGDNAVAVKYDGTGLGLAISRNIVRAMGGEIVVESILNEGTTFFVYVGFRKTDFPQDSDDQVEWSENLNLAGKRILLAEDIEINRTILIELLSDTGVIIEEAEDGEQALRLFEQSSTAHYDLVFMDVQMPNMNGYQATTAIRDLERNDAKTVPIIAMTANAYREDVERALASGMNGHLSKPIEIMDVKKLLYYQLCADK